MSWLKRIRRVVLTEPAIDHHPGFDKGKLQHFAGTAEAELRHGKGEDGKPIAQCLEAVCAVAVFDGLGGSGASVFYGQAGELETGARIASRNASSVFARVFQSTFMANGSQELQRDVFYRQLTEALEESFRNLEHSCRRPGTHPGLRGSMIRHFPTTIAAATAQFEPGIGLVLSALWAGDSRCFFLTHDMCVQLTQDHVKTSEADELVLHDSDPPMSNVLSEQRIWIEHRHYACQIPFVIIAATDGAFGYLPTPIHFEERIRSTISDVKSVDEWMEAFVASLAGTAKDDISIAAVAYGWPDFDALREQVLSRVPYLHETYIEPLDAAIRNGNGERYRELRKSLWDLYKSTFEPVAFAEATAPESVQQQSEESKEAQQGSWNDDTGNILVRDEQVDETGAVQETRSDQHTRTRKETEQ